jgi:hypothetical protein
VHLFFGNPPNIGEIGYAGRREAASSQP